jgi:hypothetical protein
LTGEFWHELGENARGVEIHAIAVFFDFLFYFDFYWPFASLAAIITPLFEPICNGGRSAHKTDNLNRQFESSLPPMKRGRGL